jgi:hypothetical protein
MERNSYAEILATYGVEENKINAIIDSFKNLNNATGGIIDFQSFVSSIFSEPSNFYQNKVVTHQTQTLDNLYSAVKAVFEDKQNEDVCVFHLSTIEAFKKLISFKTTIIPFEQKMFLNLGKRVIRIYPTFNLPANSIAFMPFYKYESEFKPK